MKKEDEKKTGYVSPKIRIVNFRTEQGYAASGGGSSTRSSFNIVVGQGSI